MDRIFLSDENFDSLGDTSSDSESVQINGIMMPNANIYNNQGPELFYQIANALKTTQYNRDISNLRSKAQKISNKNIANARINNFLKTKDVPKTKQPLRLFDDSVALPEPRAIVPEPMVAPRLPERPIIPVPEPRAIVPEPMVAPRLPERPMLPAPAPVPGNIPRLPVIPRNPIMPINPSLPVPAPVPGNIPRLPGAPEPVIPAANEPYGDDWFERMRELYGDNEPTAPARRILPGPPRRAPPAPLRLPPTVRRVPGRLPASRFNIETTPVPARLNIPNVPPAQFADDSYPYTISLNPIVNMFNSVSSNIKTANKAFYDRIISRLTNIIKDFNGVAQGESLDIEFSENRIRIDQELLELEINNVDDEIYLEQQLRMLASSYGQSLDSYSEPVRQFITSLETLKDRIESL